MPDKISAGPVHGTPYIKEAVCISTKKIYDSCRYKDCQQDVPVYLTRCGQELIERAVSVKTEEIELLWAYIDVEPISFNKGFYTVEVTYFYKVTVEISCGPGTGKPVEVEGLATFSKKLVLFGSEGSIRIFSSQFMPDEADVQNYERTNKPNAVVELADPILLSVKVVEPRHCCNPCCCCCISDIPPEVCSVFDDDLIISDDRKKLLVTIGQFGLLRLERDIQLLIPTFDICLPTKECCALAGTAEEDPCALFDRFQFPVDEFFPPMTGSEVDLCAQTAGTSTGCSNCVPVCITPCNKC